MADAMSPRTALKVSALVLFLAYCYGYFGWAIMAAAVVGLAWYAYRGWQATLNGVIAERQRHEQIAARADIQDAQVANGDPRGTYGY